MVQRQHVLRKQTCESRAPISETDLEHACMAQAPAHSLREYADAETLYLVVKTDAFASQKLYDLNAALLHKAQALACLLRRTC